MMAAYPWGAVLLYLQLRNRASDVIEEDGWVRLFGKANFGLGKGRSTRAIDP